MRFKQMIVLALFLLTSKLHAQTAYSGAVIEPALGYLNARYTPEIEHGYCISKWRVTTDSVVEVQEVVPPAGVLDSSKYSVTFICPSGQPAIHTHPPEFPRVSAQDMITCCMAGNEPFTAVQWGIDKFSFFIVSFTKAFEQGGEK